MRPDDSSSHAAPHPKPLSPSRSTSSPQGRIRSNGTGCSQAETTISHNRHRLPFPSHHVEQLRVEPFRFHRTKADVGLRPFYTLHAPHAVEERLTQVGG